MGWVARGQVPWNYSCLTTIKKKCKKAEWLSEETLQIAEKRREEKGKGEKERLAEKRREAKGKGEKERYTHLIAEFQEQRRETRKPF